MTSESVASEKRGIDGKHKCSYAKSECFAACFHVYEPHAFPCIIGKHENKENSQVHEVPVYILKYKRKGVLSEIGLARF